MLAGEVVAVEVNEARARELVENLRRLGAANVRVLHADGRELPVELKDFDRHLVDALCSGLGVLAACPDLRWRSRPLPALQLELLLGARRVRPGGTTIVYSVCTINSDEAEAAVEASGLEPDASLADEWLQFRHAKRPEFLLTLPHVHGTSGFFHRPAACQARERRRIARWGGGTASAVRWRPSRRRPRGRFFAPWDQPGPRSRRARGSSISTSATATSSRR